MPCATRCVDVLGVVGAMRKNIELKAHCTCLEIARQECLSLGAQLIRHQEQVDTYFQVPSGRLKLRQSDRHGSCLIYYVRADACTARESSFQLTPLQDDPSDLLALLSRALGVRAVVHKERDTYQLGAALINLDQVDELGTFIEIEVMTEDMANAEEALVYARTLEERFGLSQVDILPWSYADLVAMNAHAVDWRDKLRRAETPGRLFLLDGVSGSGKTTIAHRLLADGDPPLVFVPRYSTREPRKTEETEAEYTFVTCQAFDRMASSGAFIEYRHFQFGMSYGLPWQQAISPLIDGRDALGIMDLGNVRHVKQMFPEAVTILIDAPLETIRKRLLARGFHTSAQVEERLDNARTVDAYRGFYDYVVQNDDGMLDEALSSLRCVIKSC